MQIKVALLKIEHSNYFTLMQFPPRKLQVTQKNQSHLEPTSRRLAPVELQKSNPLENHRPESNNELNI